MHLRSQVRAEQSRRDNLFNEWALELRTIKLAEAAVEWETTDEEGRSVLLASNDPSAGTTSFREAHEFELAQRLIEEARIVDGLLDMPADVKLYRDKVLLEVARTNDIGHFFLSLPESQRDEALHQFGNLLVDRLEQPSDMQDLISGLQNLPFAIEAALGQPPESMSRDAA